MAGGSILQNLRLFAGGIDLTGQSNKFDLKAKFATKDKTVFGPAGIGSAGWNEIQAGLGSATVAVSGLWEAGDLSKVDDATWAALGSNSSFSAYPETTLGLATYGDPVYLLRMLTSEYRVGESPGELAPFSLSGESDGVVARGVGVHPSGAARGVNGSGTVVQYLAVPAGRHMWAALHVLSVAGTAAPTLTVTVQSAPTLAFAAPTDRIVFAAATARGGQYLNVAGPITDTFWRVSFAVAGTGPSFLFSAAIGVAN